VFKEPHPFKIARKIEGVSVKQEEKKCMEEEMGRLSKDIELF